MNIYFIIPLIFIALSAICNSGMDILREKYKGSIFEKYPKIFKPSYWGDLSWKNQYIDNQEYKGKKKFYKIPLTSIFINAWHLLKSLMIVFISFAMISTIIISNIFANTPLNVWYIVGYLVCIGLSWNVPFNFFCKKVLV